MIASIRDGVKISLPSRPIKGYFLNDQTRTEGIPVTLSTPILEVVAEPTASIPRYMTSGAAGFDFYSHHERPIELYPGNTYLVPTGVKIAVPVGFEMQIRSRSGLALKEGVFVLNSSGTVDSDYRGKIMILLANFSRNTFTITPGMRVAQGVISAVERVILRQVEVLSETERGVKGYGSTGT